MRESLCLYGLLLLGLLVARGWGRHEDDYDYCDDPYFYDYYGLCDDPHRPEQLTADSISFSYTVNARLFISWEKPRGFEHATGYTVRISSPSSFCGIPTDYEVGQTQTSLALESNETTHPFIARCIYTVQVIVNPRRSSDEIVENVLAPPGYADVVRDEIRDNAAVSCPVEFNDTAFRYAVNLTWTLPISPIILESINRFIIQTVRVNARNPANITGFFGDAIPILNTDPSRTSYSFPITYAPIFLPNTAYNNSVQVIWDSERATSLPITNLNCHIGTLPPAPGEVMDFSISEINIEEEYSAGSRTVVVDVDYTWSNLQQQQNPDEIMIDYQVAFVSDSPLSPRASSTGLQIDQYLRDTSTGLSRRRFPTAEPIFNAYLQIRARASYFESDINPRVLVGNWSDPIVVTVDEFDPPAPEEIQTITVINSAILDTIFIRESVSVLVSVQVDFEWTEPVLMFGVIQEYEAWLNFRSLGENENPENGIHTFDAEDRAGTITADFTMNVADGPTTTFRLILQIRARSEFSVTGPWSEPLVQSITVEVPLEIRFIGNTPRITGDTVRVQFTTNRPAASVRCDIDRVGRQDCSSGDITFTGLAAGRHSLHVTATNGRRDRAVERRRIEIPADPSMCVVNLINDGVTVVRDSVRIEFTTIGPAESLLCKVDREEAFPCASPVELSGVNAGRHYLWIIPKGCGRNHRVLFVKFDITEV